ncbi:hypothetical protein IUY40_13185 [Flavobacterium sp. ALJ2]|uniref:hypothetical protein n=1 Tax=Flavobacterium sp. ALJ2 TaxID=2786960 RepID=UPI00189EAFFB|nr:hypothetical protein [Flavobacterium sp. ALJ2]MBF7092487.1 hypothetical protein [Flavobacterium sp. ALJ2]
MKLINVIEISPSTYSNNNYKSPNCTFLENQTAWYNYWKKCINDSNLTELEPIEKSSYFVDINTINDNSLKIILQKALEEIDIENIDDEILPFNGGIILKINDQKFIEPNCCCDIGNLTEWLNILIAKKEEWHQLWIGHPWVFFKTVNDLIYFSDYTDENNSQNIKEKFSVSKSSFERELKKTQLLQEDFRLRIKKNIIELNIHQPDKIANLLTGLN